MAFNRGKTFVYIDDVLIDQVDAYSSETRRQIGKTWNVTPGFHTIKVVVGGGGPSGNYSDVDAFAVDIANVGTGVYDNTHSHIRYFGNWSDSSYTVGSYNDSVKVTNSPESGFRFTFTGDEITYIYSTSSNRGVAAVTIDGINKGLINQFSSDNRRQIGKTYSGLGSGVHIMNVVLTGTSQAYIDLDALVVGNVYNRAAAVAYADAWAHGRNADYPNYGTGDSCNDCTNYVSQVLEAGGMPRIADPTRDDELFWYVWTDMLGRLRGSKSWAATDWFKAHLDAFPYRYQLVGTSSRASVETLTEGDVIVMNLFFNEFNGPDHASVIMGWGSPMEPQGDTVWSQLRNAHCRDRQRVRWDLNLIPEDIYWAYKVVY